MSAGGAFAVVLAPVLKLLLQLVLFFVVFVLVMAAIGWVSIVLERRSDGRWFRQHGAPPPSPVASLPDDAWTITLLVDVDLDGRLLHPSVQLHGPPRPGSARARIELRDRAVVQLAVERPLPASAAGTELPFPAIAVPPDRRPEDLLGWCWEVVVEAAGTELRRWHEHPRPMGGVDAEAEIRLGTGPR
jgi:hypothetical protein